MSQRIATLVRYLSAQHLKSISGFLYILAALALWLIFFNPNMGSVPDPDYFVLLVGLFGFVLSILVTLSIASNANRLETSSIIARLPSRVEYLTALLLSSLLFVLALQFVLSLVILLQPIGPDIGLRRALDIPPVWIAINVFGAVLAMHASDFVMSGWSRVWIFGTITILLFSQSVDARGIRWIVDRINSLAGYASRQQYTSLSQSLREAANWVSTSGQSFLSQTVGFVFWPFRAIAEATRDGFFDNAQSLAPAILLLYATILFMLAADLFATKDLHLSE